MLRSMRTFPPGDSVQVGEAFGRVTQRGLFTTEVRTEQRDLTTLPDQYLLQNPVSVAARRAQAEQLERGIELLRAKGGE